MNAIEANFDGLVGPTHNYAGLAGGNLASQASSGGVSSPRRAALQGLEKMKLLADLGVPQAVLPPHERPAMFELRRQGFEGSDPEILARVASAQPALLAAVSSASAMWAANAATVSPSFDSLDGKLHLTPANLASHHHRSLEAATTRRILQAIFASGDHFVHHDPLPPELGDEGAANHTRLAPTHGSPGVELFVYGSGGGRQPSRFPARQTLAASDAIARQHGVQSVVLAQQHPTAVDHGVFHNDVIAVGNLTTLFLHERALLDQPAVLASLRDLTGELDIIEIPDARVSVADAVASYLFNGQLLSVADRQVLLAPAEVRERPAVSRLIDEAAAGGGPIDEVVVVDLRQSMRNGGGPACLRLRVVLSEAERAAVLPGVWLDDRLHGVLMDWVDRHYRDELRPADLADPKLLTESRQALDELTTILGLPPIYDFQL